MPILCYHSVCDTWESSLAVTRVGFDRQCASLQSRATTVDLEVAVQAANRAGRLPGRMTTVTFDDGFADNFDLALPTLQKYKIPATVFVVAATMDRHHPVDWVDDPPAAPLVTLLPDQVRALHAEGVGIGSHSLFHADLTTLSYAECLADLLTSREILEDVIASKVDYLAYPRGRWNQQVAAAAKAAGYTNAFTLPTGPEQIGDFSIPRVGIYRDNGPMRFKLKSSQHYQSIRMSRAYRAIRG